MDAGEKTVGPYPTIESDSGKRDHAVGRGHHGNGESWFVDELAQADSAEEMPMQDDCGPERLDSRYQDCGQGEKGYHFQKGWGVARVCR